MNSLIFLIKKNNLHQILIKHKIYVPTYWNDVLDAKGINDFEKDLSTFLLPLPIDQRYGINDMKTIVETIFKHIK